MQTMTDWKHHIPDLLSRAQAVSQGQIEPMSARSAACALLGVMNLISQRFGVDLMQRACADLVRCEASWATKLGTLPRGEDGRVPEPVAMLAVGARGMLPLAGPVNLRAALSFWASENNHAVWQSVAG